MQSKQCECRMRHSRPKAKVSSPEVVKTHDKTPETQQDRPCLVQKHVTRHLRHLNLIKDLYYYLVFFIMFRCLRCLVMCFCTRHDRSCWVSGVLSWVFNTSGLDILALRWTWRPKPKKRPGWNVLSNNSTVESTGRS